MKKGFKLFSAALMALAMFVPALADTVTLYDNGATNSSSPIDGYDMDVTGLRVQTILPAADLSMMNGAFIKSMKFYIADEGGNKFNGGKLGVYVGTTTQTAFSGYGASPIEGLTHVADITMTQGETEVFVEFDAPYSYAGGNLVIETQVVESLSYQNMNFYGANSSVSNVLVKRAYSSGTDAFLPKTTFEYEFMTDMATLSAQAIDFGKVYNGNEATQTITLKNMGQNAFTPVFGALQAPFSMEVAPAELAAGQSMEIPVKFAPTADGEYAQTLTIDCGAAGNFAVPVTGNSSEAPAVVVVCDGDDSNPNLPVYAYYYDMANAQSQMIYGSEMLTDLAGKKITAITFHPTSPIEFYDGVLQLSFKVVEQNAFTGYVALTDMEVVATATPNKGDTELTFVLNTPYEYTGGNLAIETLNIETGYYGNNRFYGVNVDGYYPGFYAYGHGSTDVSNFLPKATFTYEKQSTPEPTFTLGDVNHDNTVDVSDVTLLITYVLNGSVDGDFFETEANVNGDEDIDVGDVTNLISAVLGN